MDDLLALEAMMKQQRLRTYLSTPESDRLALPRMVDIYLECSQTLGRLPTQDHFLNAVVAAAPTLDADGVRARASRTYPALVRQQHFAIALRTRTKLEGVHWLPELDYRGVDLLVLHRGYAVGVALSLQTDNAARWQNVKRARHPRLDGLVMLELNVNPEDARTQKVGPFWVHPLSDVWLVEHALERHGEAA